MLLSTFKTIIIIKKNWNNFAYSFSLQIKVSRFKMATNPIQSQIFTLVTFDIVKSGTNPFITDEVNIDLTTDVSCPSHTLPFT